jgi:hypothetical protein
MEHEPVSIDSIPGFGQCIRQSLEDFGMESIAERLSIRTVRTITVRSAKDRTRIVMEMWHFLFICHKGEYAGLPLKGPGVFDMEPGKIMDDSVLPFTIRQVELLLDGSRERLLALMNGPMVMMSRN